MLIICLFLKCIQELVNCWFDSFFETNHFECPKPTRNSARKKVCPFVTSQHVLMEVKLLPPWIELQKSDRGSKERKNLLKQLLKQFHPDKIRSMGCPPTFGEDVTVLLNSYRDQWWNKVHFQGTLFSSLSLNWFPCLAFPYLILFI